MVTLQILVLPFLVRIRVSQHKKPLRSTSLLAVFCVYYGLRLSPKHKAQRQALTSLTAILAPFHLSLP